MTLAVTQAPLASLRPHPDNPRNGDVDSIRESLATNGQYRPIVVARDGTILAGNHTYMAAAELGWDSLSVVTVDVDPHDVRALRIMAADNRTGQLGTMDDGLLARLLDRIDAADTLHGTGYDADDLEALRHLANPPDPATISDSLGDFTDLDTYVSVTVRLPPDLAEEWGAYLRDNGGAESAISGVLHG